MSIIGWIVLGLIAGFIASKIVNREGSGIILDIVLGVVGALIGGWLFQFFGEAGVTDASPGVVDAGCKASGESSSDTGRSMEVG